MPRVMSRRFFNQIGPGTHINDCISSGLSHATGNSDIIAMETIVASIIVLAYRAGEATIDAYVRKRMH